MERGAVRKKGQKDRRPNILSDQLCDLDLTSLILCLLLGKG
jgi:hypothetical protein